MKQQVKLNEAQLKKIVAESVRRVLKEAYMDRSWEEKINSESFWSQTPEQIHTLLLKMGYCVGMPQKDVMDLIEWARGMFFLPINVPDYTKSNVLNIIISRLRGNTFEPSGDSMMMNTRLPNGEIYKK